MMARTQMRIVLSPHFHELNGLITDQVLDPEVLHIKMSNTPKTPSARDANGSACITVDPYFGVKAKISKYRPHPQGSGCTFGNPMELILAMDSVDHRNYGFCWIHQIP